MAIVDKYSFELKIAKNNFLEPILKGYSNEQKEQLVEEAIQDVLSGYTNGTYHPEKKKINLAFPAKYRNKLEMLRTERIVNGDNATYVSIYFEAVLAKLILQPDLSGYDMNTEIKPLEIQVCAQNSLMELAKSIFNGEEYQTLAWYLDKEIYKYLHVVDASVVSLKAGSLSTSLKKMKDMIFVGVRPCVPCRSQFIAYHLLYRYLTKILDAMKNGKDLSIYRKAFIGNATYDGKTYYETKKLETDEYNDPTVKDVVEDILMNPSFHTKIFISKSDTQNFEKLMKLFIENRVSLKNLEELTMKKLSAF